MALSMTVIKFKKKLGLVDHKKMQLFRYSTYVI